MAIPESNEISRFNAAMQFTNGDEDKARRMISGDYTDLKAVKCRFQMENSDIFGAFFIAVKPEENLTLSAYAITFEDHLTYDKIYQRDSWKTFYFNISKIAESSVVTEDAELRNHILTSCEGFDIFPDIQASDIPAVSDKLEEIINKFFNLQNALCETEIEMLSSLALMESKIPMLKKNETKASTQEDARPDIEKEADFVMNAKIIVSPVKGKYINDIRPGEIIKLIPLKDDPLSRKIAQAQKAIGENGEIMPIRGRLKAKYPNEKGYIIYCIVGKKILAKIIEEENVKIDVDSTTSDKQNSEKSSLSLYIILLVALIFISFFVIYALI
ncbi:MAG TPA: hypothetical protein PLE16_02125 [Spirochaetota bacterium]|nr:hypothetical protein [Spirochaetota bacterium]HOH36442.1 hypothetical protein [Spirochaetota bacterium]HPJ14907.1 hypothetical protein [Spirochaetota bacterium]HPM33379.1 hypothetical protein [Spirochaetota bacterium]HPW51021.1 hypothetical protein [Spirochaetota bacterium]